MSRKHRKAMEAAIRRDAASGGMLDQSPMCECKFNCGELVTGDWVWVKDEIWRRECYERLGNEDGD